MLYWACARQIPEMPGARFVSRSQFRRPCVAPRGGGVRRRIVALMRISRLALVGFTSFIKCAGAPAGDRSNEVDAAVVPIHALRLFLALIGTAALPARLEFELVRSATVQ